jgi:hypothetical protein
MAKNPPSLAGSPSRTANSAPSGRLGGPSCQVISSGVCVGGSPFGSLRAVHQPNAADRETERQRYHGGSWETAPHVPPFQMSDCGSAMASKEGAPVSRNPPPSRCVTAERHPRLLSLRRVYSARPNCCRPCPCEAARWQVVVVANPPARRRG